MNERSKRDQAISEAGDALVAAIKQALAACDPPQEVNPGVYAGLNFPELLSAALEQVCEDAGQGSAYLVRHRPGSWEATHVQALAASVDWQR